MSDFASKIPEHKIVREHLHEQIAGILEEMIATQGLPPGSRLPSERELAASFSVNRATLRLAVRLIEQRGLVEMKVGSGIYIKGVPSSTVANAIERYVNFKSCPKQDLQTFREILEPEVAVLAAQNATDQDQRSILHHVVQIEEIVSSPDFEKYASIDASFHEALALATHNQMIIAVTSGIQKVTKNWILAQHGLAMTRQWMKVVHQGTAIHRKIYEAVAAHNVIRAREAMRTHMRIGRSILDALRDLQPKNIENSENEDGTMVAND